MSLEYDGSPNWCKVNRDFLSDDTVLQAKVVTSNQLGNASATTDVYHVKDIGELGEPYHNLKSVLVQWPSG